jgi:hypothetical protein
MNINIKSKSGLQCLYNRKTLVFVSLLFVLVLVSSYFVSVFSGVSPFAFGTFDTVVSNEAELRNAITTAIGFTVIALDNDITLTSFTLTISADKDITLTSNSKNKFYKLSGSDGMHTITVDAHGLLTIDGIIVTHTNDTRSSRDNRNNGVFVYSGGVFNFVAGEISHNFGGVYNYGTFEMFGGEISGNTHSGSGGVINMGDFRMSGGKISNNSRSGSFGSICGGVYNDDKGMFTMIGGEVSGNIGDGVANSGDFSLSGGEISNNRGGSGVYNVPSGTFGMFGGEISNNKGYGVHNSGNFSLSGGEISNNVGSGVSNNGNFKMSGGKISNNEAIEGGGVHNIGDVFSNGTFIMTGGVISDNIAKSVDDLWGNGGGVYNGAALYVDGDFPGMGSTIISGGVISNNKASNGGGVYVQMGDFKVTDNSVIFDNKASKKGDNIYHIDSAGNVHLVDNEGPFFGVRDVGIIYVGIVLVMIGVIGVVLFFISKKRAKELV